MALLVVAVLQTIFYYPQLSDTVASHFDGHGRPNDWMPRLVFCLVYLVMMAILWFSFIFLPERAIGWRSAAWNIPNSKYWLAPERREQTVAWVLDQTMWCGVVTELFMIGVFQLAFEANLKTHAMLSGEVWWLLLGYFLYIAVWLVWFLVHFMRIPGDVSPLRR